MRGVSLTHPVPFFLSFLSGVFVLHIPYWLHFYLGSFSYTSHADVILSGEFHLHIPSWLHFIWGVFVTHPVLASILSADFLLHIPRWLHFLRGTFSYTSRAGFIFMRGVSLTHPVLASLLSGEFLLHIPSRTNKKSWVEGGLGKECKEVALRREKGALQHPKQNKQYCTSTEWKMAPDKEREEKKHSNAKDSYKSG